MVVSRGRLILHIPNELGRWRGGVRTEEFLRKLPSIAAAAAGEGFSVSGQEGCTILTQFHFRMAHKGIVRIDETLTIHIPP